MRRAARLSDAGSNSTATTWPRRAPLVMLSTALPVISAVCIGVTWFMPRVAVWVVVSWVVGCMGLFHFYRGDGGGRRDCLGKLARENGQAERHGTRSR